MSSESARFGTAINCMDGRTQIPVIEWMRKRYRVSYVDMITEPGVDAVLAENDDTRTIESIKRKVRISTEKHGSRLIAVVGHYDCAGNPVGHAYTPGTDTVGGRKDGLAGIQGPGFRDMDW
jgi:carbonic anhydrase